ncbi:AAA family ATPase [Candidatus Chloroploca sp. M-50]|uniref:DNA 3'-5' helicase n=1 Tax=Candidatus Chloroploca mongolica TaxID=2528176 RepID=A0ABS4DEX6_9CHLR|nr:3'-5' exonuclease [Candidatus Chloroploca mongolica]MBP1468009.1 AAA family ATPase [Candidatus Chloroploca mongolica]
MTTYELSFTPTFYNESLNLPKQVSRLVSQKLKVLADDPFSAQGDAKKLKGYNNVYRARVGDYRVFYSIGQGWVKLLSVRKRDERTYEDDLPEVVAPVVAPDPAALEPQQQRSGIGDWGSATWHTSTQPNTDPQLAETAPLNAKPSTALPFAITEAILAQWQIPTEHQPAALTARTEDDLLELPIPERYISRILDNLFPQPLAAIAAQPEFVLPTPEAIERFAEEDLGSFLLRLTPEQQELVSQERRGPTLVKGGPGTGKSTLALYRVQRLLDQGVTSILFTTYTNALVGYSEQLLTHLLGKPPAKCGVKVTTVDSLAAHSFAKGSRWPKFATEGQALDHLGVALREADIPAANAFDRQVRQAGLERLGPDYLLQEFLSVIEAWGIDSAEAYASIERRGRRTPIKLTVREAIWAVYTHWRELMRAEGIVLNEQIRRGALEYAATLDPKPYQALVIDEAQDLSPVALRFLLNLVPSLEHVYLTADASQSLYQRGFSWKQVHSDLSMAGRTLLLKRNYRNTAQIMTACGTILAGSGAGDNESLNQEPSAHQGDPPLIRLVDDAAVEAAAVHTFFVESARRYRLPAHSGAVLCMSKNTGEALARRLSELGLPAVFQSGKDVDITAQKIKVLTLHSAKGLEFPFVAVVGLDGGRFPRVIEDYPVEELAAMEDEQRRLFFVGCTRAMRSLLVCGSQETPSAFLDPLQPPTWARD